MSIILIGFMGAGKTSVAALLNENYLDTDKMIEQRVGQRAADFIRDFGLAEFRKLEEEVLAQVLQEQPSAVIATGGGIIESARNRQVLSEQKNVVYLQAAFEILLHRIQNDFENKRPIFERSTEAELREIFERREPFYKAVAAITVETSGQTAQRISEIILEKIPS